MKIELPDDFVEVIVAEELSNAIMYSNEHIETLSALKKIKPYQQEDLDYYRAFRDAAVVVLKHFKVPSK